MASSSSGDTSFSIVSNSTSTQLHLPFNVTLPSDSNFDDVMRGIFESADILDIFEF